MELQKLIVFVFLSSGFCFDVCYSCVFVCCCFFIIIIIFIFFVWSFIFFNSWLEPLRQYSSSKFPSFFPPPLPNMELIVSASEAAISVTRKLPFPSRMPGTTETRMVCADMSRGFTTVPKRSFLSRIFREIPAFWDRKEALDLKKYNKNQYLLKRYCVDPFSKILLSLFQHASGRLIPFSMGLLSSDKSHRKEAYWSWLRGGSFLPI